MFVPQTFRLNGIKNLAGQTLWYGGSAIAARFLNYLLTPFLTHILTKSDYGLMSLIYAVLPIFNVVLTYGMETAFFKFSNKENEKDVYNTSATSIIVSTLLFGAVLLFFYRDLAALTGVGTYPELMKMSIFIIMLDTFCVIPFAKLRLAGQPQKYALIKVAGIVVNIFFTVFFLWWCPLAVARDSNSIFSLFVNSDRNPVYYIVLANLLQAAVTLLLLYKEVFQIRFQFNKALWRKIMWYASPLLIAGLGGVINETLDRQMLYWLVPGDVLFKKEQVGIYSACYKLSILITLFIQAFRMGAEPFFFKQAEMENPQRTYARVMKFFVIVMTVMFLVVALYMPVWKYFISSKEWEGLSVVPILLMANMFLGIYLNLSIWYKLGNKTITGAYITFIGVAVTLLINFTLIPYFGYKACAWATFFCYGTMMVVSYVWGQKVYPIPYARKKLVLYLSIVGALFFIYKGALYFYDNVYFSLAFASLLLLGYLKFIAVIEQKELSKLPVVGKYFLAKHN